MRKILGGVMIIWYRDLLRFWRNRARVLTGFSFPVLWLLIFGNGVSATLSLPVPEIKFVQFLFPGIIAQYLIFTSMFSAISILQDREFGFLKEILISPMPRIAVALGKILGGATTAFLQASCILVLGPLVGIPLSFGLVLGMLPAMFLLSLTLSAIGVTITARMRSLDAGQYVFQFITFPIVMLSGAMFPLQNLPPWLNILVKLNPISYAVDLLRRMVLVQLHVQEAALLRLSPTMNGQLFSMWLELLIVAGVTVVLVVAASRAFNRT